MANSAITHDPSITVPASTVDNSIVRWNGTGGEGFQSTTKITIDDNGTMGIPISQTGHNLVVGNVVRVGGSGYVKALADNAGNAEVVGIVTAQPDNNNFTLTVSGYIGDASIVPNEAAGTVLFLSDTTSGLLTSTEPADANEISKPVCIITTQNTEMVMIMHRGEIISSASNQNAPLDAQYLTLAANGTLSNERLLTGAGTTGISISDGGAGNAATISLDLNGLSAAAVSVANDSIAIIDANDSNGTRKESVVDLVAAIAGTGLTASNGQLTASSGPSQASTSDIVDETNQDTYVPPDLIKHSPGVAKAWCHWEMVGTHSIKDSYNVDTVTDGGSVGNTDHVWLTAFSSINYVVVGGGEWDQGSIKQVGANKATTGMTTMQPNSANNAGIDGDNGMLAAFGEQ